VNADFDRDGDAWHGLLVDLVREACGAIAASTDIPILIAAERRRRKPRRDEQ